MGRNGVWSSLWAVALGSAMIGQVVSCGGRALTEKDDDGASGAGGTATGGKGGANVTGGTGGVGGTTSGGSSIGGRGDTGGIAGMEGGFAGEGEGEPGGGAGTAGSATGGTIGNPKSGICPTPVAWSSNLELCDDGFVHREQASACSLPTRDSEVTTLGPDAGVEDLAACHDESPYFYCLLGDDECTRDADCGANAYCLRETANPLDGDDFIIHHRCVEPCTTDADCAETELCACDYAIQNATRERVSFGTCMPASCKVDSDCRRGALCIAPLAPRVGHHSSWPMELTLPWRAFTTFHCQTAGDQCHRAQMCPVFDPTGGDCCPEAVCRYEGTRYICDAVETCDLC